jgi:hypothetical protein
MHDDHEQNKPAKRPEEESPEPVIPQPRPLRKDHDTDGLEKKQWRRQEDSQ